MKITIKTLIFALFFAPSLSLADLTTNVLFAKPVNTILHCSGSCAVQTSGGQHTGITIGWFNKKNGLSVGAEVGMISDAVANVLIRYRSDSLSYFIGTGVHHASTTFYYPAVKESTTANSINTAVTAGMLYKVSDINSFALRISSAEGNYSVSTATQSAQIRLNKTVIYIGMEYYF